MNHVAVFTDNQVQDLLSGTLKWVLRFFNKRPDLLDKIHSGGIVYFRKSKGEILGKFEIGKLIIIEKLEAGDWSFIKGIERESGFGLTKEEFEEKSSLNKVLMIVQITRIEQFITPPIEIDKRSKKEWKMLD